jgi:hypothetical protein
MMRWTVGWKCWFVRVHQIALVTLTAACCASAVLLGCGPRGKDVVPRISVSVLAGDLPRAWALLDSLRGINPEFHSRDTTLATISTMLTMQTCDRIVRNCGGQNPAIDSVRAAQRLMYQIWGSDQDRHISGPEDRHLVSTTAVRLVKTLGGSSVLMDGLIAMHAIPLFRDDSLIRRAWASEMAANALGYAHAPGKDNALRVHRLCDTLQAYATGAVLAGDSVLTPSSVRERAISILREEAASTRDLVLRRFRDSTAFDDTVSVPSRVASDTTRILELGAIADMDGDQRATKAAMATYRAIVPQKLKDARKAAEAKRQDLVKYRYPRISAGQLEGAWLRTAGDNKQMSYRDWYFSDGRCRGTIATHLYVPGVMDRMVRVTTSGTWTLDGNLIRVDQRNDEDGERIDVRVFAIWHNGGWKLLHVGKPVADSRSASEFDIDLDTMKMDDYDISSKLDGGEYSTKQ